MEIFFCEFLVYGVVFVDRNIIARIQIGVCRVEITDISCVVCVANDTATNNQFIFYCSDPLYKRVFL